MANKRVSELVQITAAELSPADLLLLADVAPNPESKKLTLTDLGTYLLSGGNLSGSLQGTASWAEKAVSASWAPEQISASYAKTSSWSWNAITASHALFALSASWSRSGSYAITASYALTSSVQLIYSSAFADYARSASYLIYSPLLGNGTASYAMLALTASYALNSGVAGVSSSYSYTASHALFSRSSSYLLFTGVANGTASYGISSSWARSGSYARTASHAIYAEVAGLGITTNVQDSASWASSSVSSSYADYADTAMNADTASFVLLNPNVTTYGIYSAITQSITSSQLDLITITSPQDLTASVDVVGSVKVPWTASIPLSETITFTLLSRVTGIKYQLDTYPVYFFMGNTSTFSGTINGSFTGSYSGQLTGSISASYSGSSDLSGGTSGSLTGSVTGSGIGTITSSMTGTINGTITNTISGTMTVPFSMMGQAVVPSGDYMLFISASSNAIEFDSNRLAKFGVSINIGTFSTAVGEPIVLYTDYPDYVTISSSLAAGTFTDLAANLSSSDTILALDASGVTGTIHNVWALSNCTIFTAVNSPALTQVGGMPDSLLTMSVVSASLTNLYSLSSTSCDILDFSKNAITDWPELPDSMSYIKCSQNPLTSIGTLPAGLTDLYCDSLSITVIPLTLPSTVQSMSFSNNTGVTTAWLSTLPSSLEVFWCRDNSNLPSLPTIPPLVSYLDVSYNNLTDVCQDTICADLVTNGLSNGYLDLRGNQTLLGVTLTRIATLQGLGWTVNYV